MADHRGIAVFCEAGSAKLSAIAAEGLGAGRKLADALGQDLTAIIIGSRVSGTAPQAIGYGATRVYVADDPRLGDYQPELYVSVMEKFVRQVMPAVIILGQTDVGRDLAPRLACRLGTAATLDCIELAVEAETGRLLQTKPVYGGNARAVFVAATDPQIVTIRPRAMPAPVPDALSKGEIVSIAAELEGVATRIEVTRRAAEEEVAGIRLEDARVVVAGGRGIGGAEGFRKLEELARLLNGAVGASRPPCDSGWVPDTVQVGLTGRIVAPELYIAVGVSGSSQHMSGCSGSQTIVAINKDKEANVFRYARFGVVGDWKNVLPAFTAKVKEVLTT